jgi:CRP-like cAMP-binding protein
MKLSYIKILQNYIRQNCNSITLSRETIENYFEEKTISKKGNFLTVGEVCKHEGFIIRGSTKTYIIDNNANEVILDLSTENWWISDLVSFQEQKPAQLTITALENTTLLTLSAENKELLLKEHPNLERMFRILVQKHLAQFHKRVFNSIALSAEERYDKLLANRPELFQRVPQYLIASYLGVTPEFLSRMRAKKVNK